jgi:hypothetical protein
MSYVHIYAPPVVEKRIVRTTCPDCGKPTRMLCFFQEWHGWSSTCIRCGRHWDDGEWIPFEFYRNARRDSIASAKRRWRSLPSNISPESQHV